MTNKPSEPGSGSRAGLASKGLLMRPESELQQSERMVSSWISSQLCSGKTVC